jgi:hypothetical protein
MPKNLFLIILVGVMLGCTTTVGRQYDTTAKDRIEVGKTTEGEVISMLGVPLSQKKFSNGIKQYNYTYGNRLPLGAGTTVDQLQVQFCQGIVTDKWQSLRQY